MALKTTPIQHTPAVVELKRIIHAYNRNVYGHFYLTNILNAIYGALKIKPKNKCRLIIVRLL